MSRDDDERGRARSIGDGQHAFVISGQVTADDLADLDRDEEEEEEDG